MEVFKFRVLFLCSSFYSSFPLFVLKQKVEQKIQEKSKCSAGFFGPTHKKILLLSLHSFALKNRENIFLTRHNKSRKCGCPLLEKLLGAVSRFACTIIASIIKAERDKALENPEPIATAFKCVFSFFLLERYFQNIVLFIINAPQSFTTEAQKLNQGKTGNHAVIDGRPAFLLLFCRSKKVKQ